MVPPMHRVGLPAEVNLCKNNRQLKDVSPTYFKCGLVGSEVINCSKLKKDMKAVPSGFNFSLAIHPLTPDDTTGSLYT